MEPKPGATVEPNIKAYIVKKCIRLLISIDRGIFVIGYENEERLALGLENYITQSVLAHREKCTS